MLNYKTHEVNGFVSLHGSGSVGFVHSHDTTGGIWWTTDCLLPLVVEGHMSLAIHIQHVAVNPGNEEFIVLRRHSIACCICHGDVGRNWPLHALCIY